jgi:hypothetical protein
MDAERLRCCPYRADNKLAEGGNDLSEAAMEAAESAGATADSRR